MLSFRTLLVLALVLPFPLASLASDADPLVLLELARARREREAKQVVPVPNPSVPTPGRLPASPSKLHNDSHTCPTCGRNQFIVHRDGAGEHSHKCSFCGTEWWHDDPGTMKSVPFPLLPTSGCESGNCPSASSSRRGLIFRR